MKHPIGFFDADCHDLNEAGAGLSLRPRMEPLAGPIRRIHALAAELRAPLVFTTCCSGRMPQPGDLRDVLFVPLDADDRSWESGLDAHRLFYLAKKTYHDPEKNYVCRAFDMFQDNGNAVRLVTALAVREWIVFGNAFDLCVNAAAMGLLAAGQQIRLLTDVTVPSARAYSPEGVDEARPRVLAGLSRLGARMSTLPELIETLRR